MNISNNKEINAKEFANTLSKLNFGSLFDNIDWNKLDNVLQSFGIGKFSDISGVESKKWKEILNDPLYREIFKNVSQDPSLVEMTFFNPIFQEKIKKIPSINLIFQN